MIYLIGIALCIAIVAWWVLSPMDEAELKEYAREKASKR